MTPRLRPATLADLPALRLLIDTSVRGLSGDFYSDPQIESGLRFVFGPDTQLITDGTYFVIEDDGRLEASGGWSRRRTLYGGDQTKEGADPLLDPGTEPARIRAFFVHPDFARRGLAGQLYARCEEEARGAGFGTLELMATLPGVPFYAKLGFVALERSAPVLPDGVSLPMVRMRRPVVPPR